MVPRETARQASQCGHGGFHGKPVTSLPHSAVSGSSSVTKWHSSSNPSSLIRGTFTQAGWTFGATEGGVAQVGTGPAYPRGDAGIHGTGTRYRTSGLLPARSEIALPLTS